MNPITRNTGARVVFEPRRGYGSAYLAGFNAARGRYIVMGDADDTYDFESLRDLVQPLEAGTHDLVIGSRLRGGIADGALGFRGNQTGCHRSIEQLLGNVLVPLGNDDGDASFGGDGSGLDEVWHGNQRDW